MSSYRTLDAQAVRAHWQAFPGCPVLSSRFIANEPAMTGNPASPASWLSFAWREIVPGPGMVDNPVRTLQVQVGIRTEPTDHAEGILDALGDLAANHATTMAGYPLVKSEGPDGAMETRDSGVWASIWWSFEYKL